MSSASTNMGHCGLLFHKRMWEDQGTKRWELSFQIVLGSEKCYHSTFTFTVHDDLLPMNNVSCYVKQNAEVLKREDAHFKISVHSSLDFFEK